jgi:NAD(P)-dependent dehydrogenase (short-subunit alcohol dehydrogenase family)
MARIVISGATGAVGGAAAAVLAKEGHELVLLGRDPNRLSAAAHGLLGLRNGVVIETADCDLSSLASVRKAAADLNARFPRIDALVHSAAVFLHDRKVTAEQNEVMFATNHLGPFLLTNLLLHRLRASAPARVVVVSAPSTTELDFGDLQGDKKWGALSQFGRTKMANLLFAYGLARRETATQVTSNVLYPGLVKSSLMRDANAAVRGLSGMMSKSPEGAGNALAWLTVHPSLATTSGQFFKLEKLDRSNDYSHDVAVQDRLWSESARLVGLV